MFKSKLLIYYQRPKGPQEKLPKKEAVDKQPVSESQDAEKLAKQAERAKRRALGRLYSNLNQKLQSARQHIKDWKMDEAASGLDNRYGTHKAVKVIMGVIKDYMSGFIKNATPNEKKLIKRHKPALQMVLSKPDYLSFSVDFRTGKPSVSYKQHRGSLLEANTDKPAPIRKSADRKASKLKSMMKKRMKAAYKQFKNTKKGIMTNQGKMLLKMTNDYFNATYNNFTDTERASLDGVSFEKKYPNEDQRPTASVYFAANNYSLGFSAVRSA